MNNFRTVVERHKTTAFFQYGVRPPAKEHDAMLDLLLEWEEALRDITNFEYSACAPEYCINRAHKALALRDRLMEKNEK